MNCCRASLLGVAVVCVLIVPALGRQVSVKPADRDEPIRFEVTVGEGVDAEMEGEATNVIMKVASRQTALMEDVAAAELVSYHDAVDLGLGEIDGEPAGRIVENEQEDEEEEEDQPASIIFASPEEAFAPRYIHGREGVNNFLLYGPYAEIPAGRYIVAFRFMPETRSRGSYGAVEVAQGGATASKFELEPRGLFPQLWNVRAVRYEPEEKQTHVEYRVWQNEIPLAVDRVYVFRIGTDSSGGDGDGADDAPPTASDEGGEAAPAAEAGEIPDEPAHGRINGQPFEMDAARYQSAVNVLELGQGRPPLFDRAVSIFLFFGSDEPDGRRFEFQPEQQPGNPSAHVHLRYQVEGQQQPGQESFTDGFRLDLEFGQREDDRLPGKLFLHLPEGRTRVIGTFDATVE